MKIFWIIYLTGISVALVTFLIISIQLKERLTLATILGCSASWFVPIFVISAIVLSKIFDWAEEITIFDFSKRN